MTNNKENLGKLIRRRRFMIPLTQHALATAAGVSPSHLGRIEKGERLPSAHTLRKLAKPLGFEEAEILTLGGFLSHKSSTAVEIPSLGRLDPYVYAVLSQEPVEIQRTVIGILTSLKSVAREYQSNMEFAEYAHRKYPKVDEDIITMIKDLLEHPPEGGGDASDG